MPKPPTRQTPTPRWKVKEYPSGYGVVSNDARLYLFCVRSKGKP